MYQFLNKYTPQESKPTVPALVFAEEVEGLLYLLKQSQKYLNEGDYNDYRTIHKTFLYGLVGILDHIKLDMPKNKRGIGDRVIKVFIKEVFVKHELQGIYFRAWDSDDLDGLKIGHFPPALKEEVKKRKLSVIETKRYWFLIAPPKTQDTNRYSLCRFLEEDKSFGLSLIYGCYVPRHSIGEPKVLETILQLTATIYTLEIAASPSVIKFIEDSKQAKRYHLQPLLRQKISFNGDINDNIKARLSDYEQKLSTLILSRLPALIQSSATNKDDAFILNHHLDVTLSDLWLDMNTFSMLPLVGICEAAQVSTNRLMCYRLFLQKLQTLLHENKDWADKVADMTTPALILKELYDEAMEQHIELQAILEPVLDYEKRMEAGRLGFFERLGLGRPRHSSDEIIKGQHSVASELFTEIIRMAKKHKNYSVYFEFENPSSSINTGDYRHYSFLHSKNAVDKLPLVVRLPEDRHKFQVESLAETMGQLR